MKITIVLTAIVSTVLTAGESHACRCIEPTTKTAYARAELVVLATIDSVEHVTDGVTRAGATVEKAWKTDSPARLTLVTTTDCAYVVEAGERHLLFLFRAPDGTYGTNRCRGNDRASAAEKRLSWLARHGKPSRVGPSPAR